MRRIRFLIRKEFIQVFRNKAILPIIFVMPIVQLLVLSYAADFEIRNLKVYWVDQDQSSVSRLLRQKIEASNYFDLYDFGQSDRLADQEMMEGKADLILQIPGGLERTIFRSESASIQLIANAIDGTKAGLGNFYMSQVLIDFNRDLMEIYGSKIGMKPVRPKQVDTTYSFWFNPELNYKTFMVPGILVLLVTMIGAFISSMNVVREKELGTIEQLNVTPIRKYEFILGKLVPFWIIGLAELTVGLIIAKLVFNIPMLGSLFVLYGFAAIYMVMILGMGMFISTMTETQQQAMFISWFFLVVFILMSGLFTPIENMPNWAQQITVINPIRYFIEVIRLVMLKGAEFADVRGQFMVISLYAIAINGLAVWRYRKTV